VFVILQLVAALRYEKITPNVESSGLVQFLFNKCSRNRRLSGLFYWHMEVEAEEKKEAVKNWYNAISKSFLELLRTEQPAMYQMIDAQIKFREGLREVAGEALKKASRAEDRTKELQKILDDKKKRNKIEGGVDGKESNLFILNPDRFLTTIDKTKSRIFRSNTAPLLLAYTGMPF
jgi:hypothetical protein